MNSATFNALADPHRFQIVELLRQRPLSVGEIAQHLQLKQPQTSKHLRVLSDAGLIHVQAQGNRRVCHLRSQAFSDLHAWLATYQQLWEERFDQLDSHLQQLAPTDPPRTDPGGRP